MGLSASTLLLLNGDIFGFSGLLSSVGLNPVDAMNSGESHWKVVWLATFMLTVNFYVNLVEDGRRDLHLETGQVPVASTAAHLLGGALVGLGTKLANGCTSGHGICGLARISRRSIVAVPLFVVVAMITATSIDIRDSRLSPYVSFLTTRELSLYSETLGTIATSGFVSLALLRQTTKSPNLADQRKVLGAAISAVLAAFGLIISGMVRKSKVHKFLDLSTLARSNGKPDPTLLTVMGSAVLVSWLGYQLIPQWSIFNKQYHCYKPLVGGEDFAIPTSLIVDTNLVMGSVLFGVGWGLTGLCPGPALFQAAAGMSDVVLAWLPAFIVGSWVGVKIQSAR